MTPPRGVTPPQVSLMEVSGITKHHKPRVSCWSGKGPDQSHQLGTKDLQHG